jgi:hypothetical protein
MNTGGPAFPYVCDADFDYGTGMTLRDYFAAKAMQAIINETSVNLGPNKEEDDMHDAKMAYRYADAMLKAREQ